VTAVQLAPAGRLPEVSAGPLVLLDFWQSTCAPCRALEPHLAALLERATGPLQVWRVDVDRDLAAVTAYDITSVPTVVLLSAGREVGRRDGLVRPADLDALLALAPGPVSP